MEWSFESSGPGDVDVALPAGVVEVDAASGGEVRVVLEAMGGSPERAADAIAAAEVSWSDGKLRVHVPDRRLRHPELRCGLRVPESSSLTVRTGSADVRVGVALRAFSGATASGDVLLSDVDADVSHRSASGDLRCGAVGGPVHVRSASGDLIVERAGAAVVVQVASGDVELGEALDGVEVKSASGDVRIGCARAGTVRVQSASGDVVVGVAAGVGARLDVTSVSGETSCSLPFQEPTPQGAALEIVCRTVSGDVRIEAAR